MLKTQKQHFRHDPVLTQLLNSNSNKSISKSKNCQIIQKYSQKKITIIQTKSDNHHDRKSIQQKKIKSFQKFTHNNLNPTTFDQYQLGPMYKTNNNNNFSSQQYNPKQILRDNTSSSSKNQIYSNRRQSKSRYKDAKQKAKKLIEKMLYSSKNNQHQLKIQMNKKINQVENYIQNKNIYIEQYGLGTGQMDLKKKESVKTNNSMNKYKPKVQKCSSLKIQLKTGRSLSRDSQNPSMTSKKSPKKQKRQTFITLPLIKPQQHHPSSSHILSQQQQPQLQPSSININPLVLKQKHLFTYKQIPTQKSIKQLKQENIKQISKQFSKKQNDLIISRAREKNKKIVRKLKQRRYAFVNGNSNNNNMNSISINKNSKLYTSNRNSTVRGSALIYNNNNNTNNNNNNNINNNNNESILYQPLNPLSPCSSTFLPLSSHLHTPSLVTSLQQTKQKILLHIQMLTPLASYAKSFTSIYQDCQQWQQLIFLLYKKYYIQRYKIYNILKHQIIHYKDGGYTQDTPFRFPFCEIDKDEINVFKQSKEQILLEIQLNNDNQTIKSSLRQLYNKFIQKTQYNHNINMLEVDDFAEDIIEDLNQEINLLVQSCGKNQKIKKRINQAIQVGLIIAYLEGCSFDDIQGIITADTNQMKYYTSYYPLFMGIFDEDQNYYTEYN